MPLEKPEIPQDLLTLEDAALLADPEGEVPNATLARVRRLVRTDPRVTPLFEYLEALAEEAGMPATSNRLHAGLLCRQELERLERQAGWRHPAEVLDPTGTVGISYPELVKLAATVARQEAKPGRYRAIQRKLERAWSEERARNALADDFAARLCEVEPEEAERLLRQAARRYRRRRPTLPIPAKGASDRAG